jgi:hypothetical protein
MMALMAVLETPVLAAAAGTVQPKAMLAATRQLALALVLLVEAQGVAVDRPPQHCVHLDVVQPMAAMGQLEALARQVAQVAQEIQALQVIKDAPQLDYPKPLMAVRQATGVMLVRRAMQVQEEQAEEGEALDCGKLGHLK